MQNDYLMHFNPFHDPKNGQFTSSGSSGGYSDSLKNIRKLDKSVTKDITKLARLNSKQSKTFNKYQKKKYQEQNLKKSSQNCLIDMNRSIHKYKKKLISFKRECLSMNLRPINI